MQFACALHYTAVRLAIACFFLEICCDAASQARTHHIVVLSSCHVAWEKRKKSSAIQ
jgi:hypothetical protein